MLVNAYPEWLDLIGNDVKVPGTISMFVNAPSGQSTLELYSDNEEITVCFGQLHSHFGWCDVPVEESFQQAKLMIDDILNERILIGTRYSNGRFEQSETLSPEDVLGYFDTDKDVRVFGWNTQFSKDRY